jgi:hypothetical protein
MKKLLLLTVILGSTVVQISCKKTKLTGDYSGLAGNWEWISGWSDNGNTNYKLDLLEKGKYKLYNGSDKIDAGRLIEKNSKLTFKSNKLFHKGYFTDEHQILFVKNDTLFIGNDHSNDFPSSVYVKR